MAGFVVDVDLPTGDAVRFDGCNATYWKDCGLPDYVGPVEGLRDVAPAAFQWLLDQRIIRDD